MRSKEHCKTNLVVTCSVRSKEHCKTNLVVTCSVHSKEHCKTNLDVTCSVHSKEHCKTNLAECWGGRGCTAGQVTSWTIIVALKKYM